MTTKAPVAQPSMTSNSQAHGSHHPESAVKASDLQLDIPHPPPPCSHDDFPSVKFWKKETWIDAENQHREKGGSLPRLRFVEDKDGNKVSEGRLKAMTEKAKVIFNTLYHLRNDPPSWKAKTQPAGEYFSNTMCLAFEEFRWCENDWKVEQFAVVRFPDWSRHTREGGGRLLRMS